MVNQPGLNLVSVLEKRAERHPDRIAIMTGKEKVTFRELFDRVKNTAGFIKNQGLNEGDCILVYIPMSIRLYEILLAIFYSGMTAVFTDAWTTRNRLSEITVFIRPKAFWGIPKSHLLRLLNREIRQIPFHWFPGSGTNKIQKKPDIATPAPVSPALITLTSGSTGFPKAASRSHQFLLAQHSVLSETLNLSEGSVDMPTLPVFVLNNLASGITTLLPDMDFLKTENVNPTRILAQWNKQKVNSVTGSPVFFQKLTEHILKVQPAFPPPEKIFIGGAPVFPALAKKLKAAFPKTQITIVYGSTEAEPISELPLDEFIRFNETNSVSGLLAGRPVSQIELAILPISENPISCQSDSDLRNLKVTFGQTGEIVVRGSHVLTSYFNQPEEEVKNKIRTAESVWHRTGDAGFLDDQGRLFLTGRANSAIRWKNRMLFSFPAEIILSSFPEVKNSALLKKGEKLYLALALEGTKFTDDLKTEMETRLSAYLPEKPNFRIFSKLPTDPRHNSKIDYSKLLEMITEDSV